jgi:hypothetical protein
LLETFFSDGAKRTNEKKFRNQSPTVAQAEKKAKKAELHYECLRYLSFPWLLEDPSANSFIHL